MIKLNINKLNILFPILTSVISINCLAEEYPIPHDFQFTVQRENHTFQIMQDEEKHGKYHPGAKFKCLEPEGKAAGNPYVDGQHLIFTDCDAPENPNVPFQYFFYKDGNKIQTAVNSVYGTGEINNYCLALELDGTAKLQSCDHTNLAQLIHLYEKDALSRYRRMVRSAYNMCLAQADDRKAIAIECGPHEDTPDEWMTIRNFHYPTETRAHNASSFGWVQLHADKRLSSDGVYSYRKSHQVSRNSKSPTIFIFPGLGSRLDLHYQSLAWYSETSVHSNHATKHKTFTTWVSGHWHLVGHIIEGHIIEPKAYECTYVVTHSTGLGQFLPVVSLELQNRCNRRVRYTFSYRHKETGVWTEDGANVNANSSFYFTHDVKLERMITNVRYN